MAKVVIVKPNGIFGVPMFLLFFAAPPLFFFLIMYWLVTGFFVPEVFFGGPVVAKVLFCGLILTIFVVPILLAYLVFYGICAFEVSFWEKKIEFRMPSRGGAYIKSIPKDSIVSITKIYNCVLLWRPRGLPLLIPRYYTEVNHLLPKYGLTGRRKFTLAVSRKGVENKLGLIEIHP